MTERVRAHPVERRSHADRVVAALVVAAGHTVAVTDNSDNRGWEAKGEAVYQNLSLLRQTGIRPELTA